MSEEYRVFLEALSRLTAAGDATEIHTYDILLQQPVSTGGPVLHQHTGRQVIEIKLDQHNVEFAFDRDELVAVNITSRAS